MSTIRLTHNLHLPTIRVQPKRVNKTQDQSEQIGQFWKFLATKAKVAQIFWALKLFKNIIFSQLFWGNFKKKIGILFIPRSHHTAQDVPSRGNNGFKIFFESQNVAETFSGWI